MHVDRAVNRQTSTSVVVEENGLYQVTIFPIEGESGIVNSSVEYVEQLMVDDDSTATVASAHYGNS